MSRRRTELRRSLASRLDGLLFAFAGLSAAWLAYLLFQEGAQPGWPLVLLVLFWLLVTYLVLPRLHRVLTRIYVPGYFIGRARTSDGLLGDPVNLGLLGHEAQVHEAMTAAGWTRADDLSLTSGLRIVGSTLSRRSYAEAPVSPLLLFDRQQDFAYQQEVAGSPSKRHHVRFWRAPEGWMLPGGYAVDWLAAGTYDRRVGLSLFTLQITHKIEANTDVERDYIIATVTAAEPAVEVDVIRDFSTGYHSRNGGGDLIETDGDLPIVDVRSVVAAVPEPVPTDSRDKRPVQTTFGSMVAVARGLGFLAVSLLLIFLPDVLQSDVKIDSDTGLTTRTVLVLFGALLAVFALWDIGLGLATFFGRNWSRVLLMLTSVLTVIVAFVANLDRSEVTSLRTNLVTVAVSILVLLALSSHRARDYAARGRATPKRLAGRPHDQAVV